MTFSAIHPEPQPISPTSQPELPDALGNILPRPNSGIEPEHASDPGGWQQLLVLVIIVGAIGLIAAFIWRESRRKRSPDVDGVTQARDG